jgi:hypothetical protein
MAQTEKRNSISSQETDNHLAAVPDRDQGASGGVEERPPRSAASGHRREAEREAPGRVVQLHLLALLHHREVHRDDGPSNRRLRWRHRTGLLHGKNQRSGRGRERERGVSRGKVVVEVGRGRNQEADQELLVAGALVWGFFLGRADQLDSDRNRMRANFTAGFLDR